MTTATAPGKIILVGEHAVVYGRPAIAAPVWGVRAIATITDTAVGAGCTIVAPNINMRVRLAHAAADHALALVTRLTLAKIGIEREPNWLIEVHSELPIAGGLGSGAALSAALVRAIFTHCQRQFDPADVNEIVFASEKIYHGNPSGIDNTVISYGLPIWFVKGQAPQPFTPASPLTILIADSGIRSPTKETVSNVRTAWMANRDQYEVWFDEISSIAQLARHAIEQGEVIQLGALLNQNHAVLQKLRLSSPVLDRLVNAATSAGALGAKLSGGGRGGNVIAFVAANGEESIRKALLSAGAKQVLATLIE